MYRPVSVGLDYKRRVYLFSLNEFSKWQSGKSQAFRSTSDHLSKGYDDGAGQSPEATAAVSFGLMND